MLMPSQPLRLKECKLVLPHLLGFTIWGGGGFPSIFMQNKVTLYNVANPFKIYHFFNNLDFYAVDFFFCTFNILNN